MSNVRILCKGLAIEEPCASPAREGTAPQSIKSDEGASSDPFFNRKLLLDKAERHLYVQIKRFDQADTKTGLILGFTLVANAQVILAIARLSVDERALLTEHLPLLCIIVVLFAMALGATIWAVSFGLLALEPREMKYLSVKDELQNPDIPTKDLLASCVRGLAAGMDWNKDKLEAKLKQSKYAAYGVGLSIICYVAMAATIALASLL